MHEDTHAGRCDHCGHPYAVAPAEADDGTCGWWCRDRLRSPDLAARSGLPCGDDEEDGGQEDGPALEDVPTARLAPG